MIFLCAWTILLVVSQKTAKSQIAIELLIACVAATLIAGMHGPGPTIADDLVRMVALRNDTDVQ